MLWLTGSPGAGKSTSAQRLAREKGLLNISMCGVNNAKLSTIQGFVYYEGDCFAGLRNPYIPLDVENPSLAQIRQKELVGEGIEERRELGRCRNTLVSPITRDFDSMQNFNFIESL